MNTETNVAPGAEAQETEVNETATVAAPQEETAEAGGPEDEDEEAEEGEGEAEKGEDEA